MKTPFDNLMADEDALRVLGRVVIKFSVASFVIGMLVGILIFWLVS
jgi:hypothetical protein